MDNIRETFTVGGVEYDLVDLDWGGSITSGAPPEIVNAKHSAISGSAGLMLESNVFHMIDEGDFPPIRVGQRALLTVYRNNEIVNQIWFWLTNVKITPDKAEVSFSTDSLALSNLVRVAPQARHMPAGWDISQTDTSAKWASGLGEVWSNPSPMYPVFWAFRMSGFHIVPPIYSWNDTIIDLPLQFSAIPEAWNMNSGHCVAATSLGGRNAPNDSGGTQMMWRDGMTYLTNGRIVLSGSRERNWGTIGEVVGYFQVGLPASDDAEVVVVFGGGNWITFTVRPDGSGVVTDHSDTVRVEFPAGSVTDGDYVKFGVSNTRGWWVRAGSAYKTGPFSPSAANNPEGDTKFTGIQVRAYAGARIAGVQIIRNKFDDFDIPGVVNNKFPRDAYIYAPLSMWQDYSKGVRDEEARDVLDQAAEAVCGSWWIDENNKAVFKDMKALYDSPTSKQLTFDSDVSGYEITDADTEARTTVQVKYSGVAYSRNKRARVLMFMGPGERMDAGDEAAYLVEPPAGEDWVGVDWNVSQYTPSPTAIQPATEGSWIYDINPDAMKENTKAYDYLVARHNPWSATINVRALGPITLTANQGIVESKLKFPLVRGRGKMQYADEMVSLGVGGGSAPFVVDGRYWVNTIDSARGIADFLLNTVPANKPSMSYLEVVYMPEVKLGDVILLKPGGDSAFERRLLVLGVQHPSNEYITKLTVLELSSLRRSLTWAQAEYNAAGSSDGTAIYSNIEANRNANNTLWPTVEGDSVLYPYGV